VCLKEVHELVYNKVNKKLLILFVLFYDYYILHVLTCMDASLKNVCTVSFTYTAYEIRSEKQTSLTLRFQTFTVQIHPHLNILTVSNWLAV
jgi:hypothetical protein